MSVSHTPKQNHLLCALPEDDYRRLLPKLEFTQMPLGWVVYEAGGHLGYVYFPTTSIVSLLCVMENGSSAEIAIIGNEGLIGIAAFMGGDSTSSRGVVQCAGHAYRLEAVALRSEFEQGGQLQHLLLRYTQALVTQLTQAAACNRHHSVEQRLCRWLLSSLDRLPNNDMTMPQELLASLPGVRREGIIRAAGNLQADGLIRYDRGRITVLDRPGLEHRACECYAVVKTEMERLLPDGMASRAFAWAQPVPAGV